VAYWIYDRHIKFEAKFYVAQPHHSIVAQKHFQIVSSKVNKKTLTGEKAALPVLELFIIRDRVTVYDHTGQRRPL